MDRFETVTGLLRRVPAPFGVVQVVAVAAGRVTVLAGGVLTRIAQH